MTQREYKYKGKIWRPSSTSQDENSLFHSIFGKGEIRTDKDVDYRRNCLINYFSYFDISPRNETLNKWLNTLEPKESPKTMVEKWSTSQNDIQTQYIPIIATLENTVIVLFVEDEVEPKIFCPDENFLKGYPWKIRNDVDEAVVCLCGKKYCRLVFDRYEESVGESFLAQAADDDGDELSGKTYSKLSGCAGIRGVLYQIGLLTIYLLKGTRMFKRWRLSTENKTMDKFDDVVLEVSPRKAFLVQAKQRQNRKVNYDELFSTNAKKDDFSIAKYYLSYQTLKGRINIEKMTVCTNTELNLPKDCTEFKKGKLETGDILHVEGVECYRYTLNDVIVTHLVEASKEYRKENLSNTTFDDSIFNHTEVEKFLSKFQLITQYPLTGYMDSVIEKILLQESYCTQYETKDCSKYLNEKMIGWFENEKGRYLTQNTLRIFLSKFRSNKFCEKLRNFQIHMDDSALYNSPKKLLLIESSRGYILNMIKVYSSLYNKRCLYTNPKDEAQLQIDTIKAFGDSNYEILVGCFKSSSDTLARETCDEITRLVKNSSYKRVIMVTERCNYLATLLKEENGGDYEEIFENIKFDDLNQESQRRLLNGVVQFFHASI